MSGFAVRFSKRCMLKLQAYETFVNRWLEQSRKKDNLERDYLLANTNVFSLAFIHQSFHGLPSWIGVCCKLIVDDRLAVRARLVFLERDRPVHQVKVDIIGLKSCKSKVYGRFDVFWCVESIPELGSDPDVGTSDFILLERIADFVLVLWRNVVRHKSET